MISPKFLSFGTNDALHLNSFSEFNLSKKFMEIEHMT